MRTKSALLAGLMMCTATGYPVLAFNAPQPIRHADMLHFFGVPSPPPGRSGSPLRPSTGTPGESASPTPSGAAAGTGGASGAGAGAGATTGQTGDAQLRPPIGQPQAPKNLPSGSSVIRQPGVDQSGGATGAQPDAPEGPVLMVTQALNQGLLRSPRMEAVRAQLQITKTAYLSATQMPNPTLIRDEGYIAEQTTRFGMQTVYELPWKIAFRLLMAKRQMKVSKLEILNTMWLFRNDMRRIYTETVVAQETYQTLSDLADLSRRLMDVSQKRFQAGDVPELDVLKARLAYSQTEIDRQWGARRITRQKQQLNIIMGSNIDTRVTIPRLPTFFQLRAEKSDLLPDFDRPVPPLQDLLQLAMANRLELKLIKQQIALAKAQLYNATGNIVPNPVVATGKSITGNPPVGPKLNGYFISLNFELPVLNFQQGEIARFRATIRQYYRQFNAQENQITGEVSAAYNNLLAARERIRVYQEHVLADSLEVARLAQRSYEVGQSDITATLAAQQANVQVRSQYLDAVSAYQQAFTDLEQAVGEPLQ